MSYIFLKFIFWGTILVSCAPLALTAMEASFGSSIDEHIWLISLIFLAFGHGISSIQNAFKITNLDPEDRARLFFFVSVVLVFVVVLPAASVRASIGGATIEIYHFVGVVIANLLLLRCAFLIDVVYALKANTVEKN